MSGVSKSQVSRLCAEIDERVQAFLHRPIEGDWPYLWIDATYVKVRETGRIISVAVIIAVGVNTDGRREVLGMTVGASEAEPFWTEFLRSLNASWPARRQAGDLRRHEGLKAAATKVLKATWQRCRVHFMRNAMAHAGKTQRRMVSAGIGTAFAQDDADAARTQWRTVADQLRRKFRKLATLMDDAENDVLAFTTFPKEPCHSPESGRRSTGLAATAPSFGDHSVACYVLVQQRLAGATCERPERASMWKLPAVSRSCEQIEIRLSAV